MPYPRELNLDDDTKERLISYLDTELLNHDAERGEHIEDLMRWQKDYWAKPTTEKATFPFSGAATIVIPLDAIAVEAIHSRSMTTRFALTDIVSAHSISNDWDDAAQPVERFMNREILDRMKIRRPLGDCYLEATKFGSMIGKVGYEKIVKTSVRQVGEREEEYDITVKDGAQFDPVADARFIMPHSSRDPQTAPWCGEEHSETPYDVMTMEQGGMFKPGTIVDEAGWETDANKCSALHAWINRTMGTATTQGGNKFERNQEQLEHTQAQWPKRIDWVEVWLAFDVDRSGKQKEICVHYHREAKYLMSVRYNWHSNLRRPYRTNVYFPVEHRWRGIGVCKKNEQFQKEITTQHRQRLDNATLANMRMIKISKLSGYGPKEPIFPGKMWFLDDMSHIETFQLGEIYPSSFSDEQASLIYSQQRTGVNEVTLGMPQVGTPGTATSDLARIQEGNKKFDFIYANFNEFTGEIIVDVADVIQQFGPRRQSYFDTAANGDLVKAFFDMPASYIRDGLLISLKSSGQQQNKLVDRQNWQQIAALLQQYYEGLLQLATQSGQPQLAQTIVMKGMAAATEAMKQILESFDIRNIDRIIVKEIEDMVKNGIQSASAPPGQPGANGAGPVGPQQPSGAGAVLRMDQLAQTLPRLGQNGNGVFDRLLNR